MAREHARILTRTWDAGSDFLDLSADAQRLYWVLLSQKTINNAGVLPLQPARWARTSRSTTVEYVERYLGELIQRRYVFVDRDTEEVLVRTYIRNDGVVKQPNILVNALRQARQIESPLLRRALAAELRRLGRRIADEVAEEIDPGSFGEGFREPFTEPFGNASGTLPSHVDNPPESVDNNPSGNPSPNPSIRNPSGNPCGEGEGEGGIFTPVGGPVGGSRVGAHVREAPSPAEQRPPARCPRHRDDPDPPNCRACGDARRTAETWDRDAARRTAEARSADARQRAETRQRAIDACGMCDERGYDGRRVCDHDPDAADRHDRGRTAARAALTPTPPERP